EGDRAHFPPSHGQFSHVCHRRYHRRERGRGDRGRCRRCVRYLSALARAGPDRSRLRTPRRCRCCFGALRTARAGRRRGPPSLMDAAIPIALTIAGSDSSGGAGIQADLKTFAALGVYGASVITALTAQNTTGVSGIHEVPPDFVTQQIDAVFSDLTISAVKI